jgi:asparagine synthase (glutamine-hydrolysing)
MSGIFGMVRRDGAALADELATMREAMPRWGPDGFGQWQEGVAGLGQARLHSLPESRCEDLPAWDESAGFAFTAAGRLDNRQALVDELSLSGRREPLADTGVMMAAYRRWRDTAAERLQGDWALAAWHPAQRRLFVARDPFGETALYYCCHPSAVAFASSQRAVVALGLSPIELDELYLAQYLISWPAYHGERTAASAARRLPPAHTLTVTPEGAHTRLYRRLEDQPVARMKTRDQYVTRLRDTFSQAVSTRLRTSGPVGVAVSGGLDSTAVAAVAAEHARRRGERLTAFTSVPIASARDDELMFGDELPLVRALAQLAGNIDVEPVTAAGVSPIQGIRWALEVYAAPIHAASNMFWLLELHRQAAASGHRVLLNGAVGNGGISWGGNPLSQPLAGQVQTLGAGQWGRRARQVSPRALWSWMAKRRQDPRWYRATAIAPAFAQRLDVGRRRLEDPKTFPRNAREERLVLLKPGRSMVGLTSAELSAYFGLDVRDPTGDLDVLQFTLSVPDRIFRAPHDGGSRWLIREAMRGLVPDQIRLNRRKGLQAADLVARLQRSGDEVEEALAEVAGGPAADYVDIAYMRECWTAIRRDDNRDTHRLAVSVLTRGIMGGLFANAAGRGELPGPATPPGF